MDEKGRIFKGARIEKSAITDDVMQDINAYTLSELSADDVFTFKVATCDNAVDRDFEAFSLDALKQMRELFIGKTIIKDHQPSADNQIARIFATELVEDETKTGAGGEVYTQLVAHCYMLKTSSNADLIAEIAAGIKKEVSVGFSVSSSICSICGTDNAKKTCSHWWGKEYDGEVCYFTLAGVSDAYELSFVAVPAQRAAGVVKSYNLREEKAEDVEEEPKPEDIEEEVPEVEEDPEDGTEPPEGEEDPEPEDGEGIEKRMRANAAYIYVKSKRRSKNEQTYA